MLWLWLLINGQAVYSDAVMRAVDVRPNMDGTHLWESRIYSLIITLGISTFACALRVTVQQMKVTFINRNG